MTHRLSIASGILALCAACSSAAPGDRAPTSPRQTSPGTADADGPAPSLTRIWVAELGGCGLTKAGRIACWGTSETENWPELSAQVRALSGLRAVSSSGDHACAIDGAGKLLCWGDFVDGATGLPPLDQVADDDDPRYQTITRPLPDQTFTHVATTQGLTCAVTLDGRLACMGVLPMASKGLRGPRFIPDIDDAVAVALGEEHACVLLRAGRVACWGSDSEGEVWPEMPGDDDLDEDEDDFDDEHPHPDDSMDDTSWEGEGDHEEDAEERGEEDGWPEEDEEDGARYRYDNVESDGSEAYLASLVLHELRGLPEVVQVAVADQFSCARTKEGEIWCWGNKSFGLVDGRALPSHPEPLPGISDAIDLAASSYHACAVRAGGSVMCWGDGSSGALGDGTTLSRTEPVRVTGIESATQLALSAVQTCALQQGQRVSCWGDASLGAFGIDFGESTVVRVPDIDATRIFAFDRNTCATLRDKRTVCWGSPFTLYANQGPLENIAPRPIHEVAGDEPRALLRVLSDLCVLDAGRTMRCWIVRLPQGEKKFARELADVVQLEGTTAMGCARHGSGRVSCWRATSWPMGEGEIVLTRSPVPITGVEGARDIGVANYYGCAALTDGSLTCWGKYPWPGGAGAGAGAGSDETAPPRLPFRVPGITDAIEVAGNGDATCIRTPASRVRCWGIKRPGSKPVDMGLTDIAQLVDLESRICARGHGGGVWCWSTLRFSSSDSVDPARLVAPVEGVRDVTELQAGLNHVCGRQRSGEVMCWGSRSQGELGAVPPSLVLAPMQVYPPPTSATQAPSRPGA